MRVLYWSPLFWPYIGGLENFAAQLVPALRQRGHEILVATSHDYLELPDAEEFKGIQIRRFHFRDALGESRLDRLMELRREVTLLKREFAPSLIHVNANFSPADFFHALTAHSYPAPTVITLHNQWNEERKGIDSTAQAMRQADWVTCVSQASLFQARKVLPEIADRSSVIYNGLELPVMAPTPLPWEPPRLLCLGRLSREKGFDLALMAFATVSKCFPTIRMMIAGDGPERNALEFQSARLGLTSKVNFLGWVSPDGVPALINSATIVILPSRSEGLPLVIGEAGYMGRPIVAARVGGLPEILLHQKTGMLVDKDDSGGLGEAIAFLLRQPKIAVEMGQKARARALELFGFTSFVDAYDALYQKVVSIRSLGPSLFSTI
jgi:glycogen(starch) synthase